LTSESSYRADDSDTAEGRECRFASVRELLQTAVHLPSGVRMETFAGDWGNPYAETSVKIRTPRAIGRLLWGPAQIGLARSYVVGEIEIIGDPVPVMEIEVTARPMVRHPNLLSSALRELGVSNLRPSRALEIEARLSGRLHSLERDHRAVAFHYGIPSNFFEILLGPTMSYTCAFFPDDNATLETAQATKFETICRKLDLRPGMHLLDVGCGWGGLITYAAQKYGCNATGVTLGEDQARYARRMAEVAGVGHLVTVRQADYRQVAGQFDAVAAVGVFEHIGLPRRGPTFFDHVRGLLAPGSRFLNHAISTAALKRGPLRKRTFCQRFVFPDGELHQVGETVGAIAAAGLEVLSVEGYGAHYVRTLQAWRERLEGAWPQAIAAGGVERARVTRLYLAGFEYLFARGKLGLHQVLSARPRTGQDASTPVCTR
jgi:cyclopropane-fatty-acyl-phospholipid synthase